MIPSIVILYTILQTILFLSTYGIPLMTKVSMGYNTEFLNSLPVILRPAENKIGQILLTTLSGVIGWKLIEEGMSHGKREIKEQIVLDLISITYITLIFLFPIQMQSIVTLLTMGVFGLLIGGIVLDEMIKRYCFPLWNWYHKEGTYSTDRYTEYSDTEIHEGAYSTMVH